MSRPVSLVDRQADFTRRLILESAVAFIEESVDLRGEPRMTAEVTLRAVAKRANISERTLFRYFSTREEFFDALVDEIRPRIAAAGPPGNVEELLGAPGRYFALFEAQQRLVLAGMLVTELFHRIRTRQITPRLAAVQKIVDGLAPRRSARERRLVATNITFHLGATAWRFFRFSIGFDFDDSVAAAESAIRQFLDGIR
jgi:AcrR family transcriptional regulator